MKTPSPPGVKFGEKETKRGLSFDNKDRSLSKKDFEWKIYSTTLLNLHLLLNSNLFCSGNDSRRTYLHLVNEGCLWRTSRCNDRELVLPYMKGTSPRLAPRGTLESEVIRFPSDYFWKRKVGSKFTTCHKSWIMDECPGQTFCKTYIRLQTTVVYIYRLLCRWIQKISEDLYPRSTQTLRFWIVFVFQLGDFDSDWFTKSTALTLWSTTPTSWTRDGRVWRTEKKER